MPGSPWENGNAESFFSRLRDERLNVEEFMNLAEGRWNQFDLFFNELGRWGIGRSEHFVRDYVRYR